MNRLLFDLSGAILLTGIAAAGQPDDRIRQVENGLLPPVLIKGVKPAALEERMRHHGVPGVSIAVFRNFTIEWAKGYGVKEADSAGPPASGEKPGGEKGMVDAYTLFQAASISKPVAAAVALRKVEEGKLLLEEDINTHLRSWKVPENTFTKSSKVTLEKLLSHTAGMTVHGFPGYKPGTPIPAIVQVLEGEPPANTQPVRVDVEPGTLLRYSGGGVSVVQLAVTDLEGRPYPEIARAAVLGPAGMTSSTFEQPLPPDKLALAASGHRSNGTVVPGKWHVYPEMAAAGLWTTPTDLARFAIEIQRAWRGDPGRVLSPEMARRMLSPVRQGAALGFFIYDELGEPYFQHGGANEGFRSALVAHRDSGYGAVVMVNSDNGMIMDEILRAVASVYGWNGYLPAELEPIALGPDQMAKYAGTFSFHEDDALRLRVDGSRLISRGADGLDFQLHPLSPTEFAMSEVPGRVQFHGTPSGGFDSLLLTGRRGMAAKRTSVSVVLPRELLERGDVAAAFTAYREIRRKNPGSPAVEEQRLNTLGYEYLSRRKLDEAIAIFRLNAEFYPESWNVYDSLGEAYMYRGEKELAARNYRISVEMNPDNEGGKAALRALGVKE